MTSTYLGVLASAITKRTCAQVRCFIGLNSDGDLGTVSAARSSAWNINSNAAAYGMNDGLYQNGIVVHTARAFSHSRARPRACCSG